MLFAQTSAPPSWLTWASGWIALGFLGLLGIAILYYIFTERIDLSRLLSEANGDASMSRFQLLIFTFVVAASLFLIVASPNPPAFPKEIPQGVLILLGISSTSYLVSKGIQFSSPEGITERGTEIKITSGSDTTSAGGSTIQFHAEILRMPNGTVDWSLDPAQGMGAIDQSGLYTPPAAPAGGAPKPTGTVTVKAVIRENPSLSDTATIKLV
jgi:hypothetical protein